MGWFGRKSADAPPMLLSSWAEESPFPASYDAQLREVFVTNPVGQRATRLVTSAVGSLRVYALEGDTRAVDLITGSALLERVAADLLLTGNAFLQVIEAFGAVAELCPLRPERVFVENDERGWPVAYAYRVRSKVTRIKRLDDLSRTQLIHLKALNPLHDQLGLGCLAAACPGAAIHNRASRWNKALLDNSARPSGALSYAPADGAALTVDQFARLREEIDRQFSGSGNAGRPMLLEGGLKWQSLGLTPMDMDFVAVKEAAARDVALALGVPPVLLGLPGDTTYANMKEAGRALYRQTVLPMGEAILRDLSRALKDWFGPLQLAIDTDAISELAEDRERLWTMVKDAAFLSDDEKRELLGFAPRAKA